MSSFRAGARPHLASRASGHPPTVPVPRSDSVVLKGFGTPEWRGDFERWARYFAPGAGYVQGDTAVQHVDGAYTFHGRSDEVMNVGGNRIGTEEIENAILLDRTREGSTLLNCAVVGMADPCSALRRAPSLSCSRAVSCPLTTRPHPRDGAGARELGCRAGTLCGGARCPRRTVASICAGCCAQSLQVNRSATWARFGIQIASRQCAWRWLEVHGTKMLLRLRLQHLPLLLMYQRSSN